MLQPQVCKLTQTKDPEFFNLFRLFLLRVNKNGNVNKDDGSDLKKQATLESLKAEVFAGRETGETV